MAQEKLQTARKLIEAGNYREARAILITIAENPTAASWIRKIDERLHAPAIQDDTPEEKAGMSGCFQIGWGILFLLSLGWIGFNVARVTLATGDQLNSAEAQASEGFATGTMIGGGLGISVVLCIGIPLMLFFGVMYWRNRVAIREAKRHNQTIQAMRTR